MKDKVLITGATGFIGSHLVELSVKKGYKVIAFDRYNPNNDWGWLENSSYKKDFEVILGDIRDYDSVSNAMKSCKAVFHLAALIGIPYSYISPLAYIRTNIEGTYNVLEAAKLLNVEEILITSTSETYGSAQYTPIDEQHPLVGQSPYSATKISADQLTLSYFKSFKTPVKIVRPFNTYGPRQSSRAIIPTIVTQMLNNKKKIKLGSLYPTRDFTYVEDICKAYIEIYKSKKLFGEIVNVGTKSEISVKKLFEKIKKITNKDCVIVTDKKRIRVKNSEVNRLVCNNKKILKLTNWKPSHNLEFGLSKTIEWIKKFKKQYKHDQYNV